MHTRISLILIGLSVGLSNFSKAQDETRDLLAEITGTITNLTCVYNNRNDISLERRVNPVPIFVKACSLNYPPNFQRSPNPYPYLYQKVELPHPYLYQKVELPDPYVELIPSPFYIPPIDKWPLFTLVQLDRLGCHLKVWIQKNPTFKPNDIITIDLSQPCNE